MCHMISQNTIRSSLIYQCLAVLHTLCHVCMHNGKNILSHIYYCFKPVDVFLQERCGATLLAISLAIYCFIPIQVRVLH